MITKIPCFLTQNMTKFTTPSHLLTLSHTFKFSEPTCPARQNQMGKGEVDIPLSWTPDGRVRMRIREILQWCRWSSWCKVWCSRMFFMEVVISSKAARYRLWWIEVTQDWINSLEVADRNPSLCICFTCTKISLWRNYPPLFGCTLGNILVSFWNLDDSGEGIPSIYCIDIKWHVESPSDMECLPAWRSLRGFLTPDC